MASIVGRGIKYGVVSTRQELDTIISDRPVYVGAYDGHTVWANTKALEMADILDEGRENGPNGIIIRDENGLATGELREMDAMDAVRKQLHAYPCLPAQARVGVELFTHPDDLPRFKRLGVIACMQTSHARFSLKGDDFWPERVGEKRWPFSFAWRAIKNAGAHLALGSDWTVAPFDPMINIHFALNREKWSPVDPDQRLTLEECIIGYTRDAAYAEFKENKDQLKGGYLADMVSFSEDLFKIPSEEILRAKAVMTMVDGRIVHEAVPQ